MTDVMYDPFNADNRHNPYPLYKRMREEAPVWLDPTYDNVFFSRHADCLAILRDAERWSTDSTNVDLSDRGVEPTMERAAGFLGGKVMLFSDPPDHTRLRKLASYAFHPPCHRAVAAARA